MSELRQGVLAWGDEYFSRIKPWVVVRESDQLLIKRPNQAVKLNQTGARILSHLLNGVPVKRLIASLPTDHQVIEMVSFLVNVRQHLEGELRPCQELATEHQPLELNFTHLPILAELAITEGCNLACRFCYAGCASPKSPPKRLTKKEYRGLIEMIALEAGVPSLSFTGGEPTTNPDLLDLVAQAKKFGMRVNLITNGVLVTPSLAKKLAQAGLDSAQVSLEGPDAATHEALTQVSGSFEATLSGIRALDKAGVMTHFHTTLTRANRDRATQLPAFAQELGLDRLSMNFLIPTGSALESPELAIRYHEIGDLVLAVKAAAERVGVEFFWYSPTPLCLFNPIAHGLGNKGCSACDGLLSISADGRLAPCSSWDGTLGSFLEHDFLTVWDESQAARIRAKELAPPGCRECEDFNFCHGACPLYFKHFGFAELPHLAEVAQ